MENLEKITMLNILKYIIFVLCIVAFSYIFSWYGIAPNTFLCVAGACFLFFVALIVIIEVKIHYLKKELLKAMNKEQ